MNKVYCITPLEKKSIYVAYEMFRSNADGSTSWFNIEDHYRWGKGFINEDMSANLPYEHDTHAYCDPNAGWGSDLEDSVACYFEFSDDLSDEEKQEIEEAYHQGGTGWLYEGDHKWEEEDSAIVVIAPFRVELCKENGVVIQSDIQLRTAEAPSTEVPEWPPFEGIKA